MDGFGDLNGSEFPVVIAGRRLMGAPLNAKMIGTLRNICFKSRPDPLDEIKPHLEGLPREVACHAWDRALEERRARGTVNDVSQAEWSDWIMNRDGWMEMLWISVRHSAGIGHDTFLKLHPDNPQDQKDIDEGTEKPRMTWDEVAIAVNDIMEASGFDVSTNPTDPAEDDELNLLGEVTIEPLNDGFNSTGSTPNSGNTVTTRSSET